MDEQAGRLGLPTLTEKHKTIVSTLSQQVEKFYASDIPFRIFHGSTNATRPSVRTLKSTIDISSLNNVLSVSTSNRTCLVEPNVPMDALVAATLPYGLVPPVVPEFPGITVGGAFAGTAGESSSFKYGFFDRAVNFIEVILADGQVVVASKAQNQDLFNGMAGTFGTLGVTTLFEIWLIPAGDFVQLSYIPVSGIEKAQDIMQEIADDQEVGFLDGIMFYPQNGVVMAGKMVNRNEADSELAISTFTKPWDPWFYLHAEQSTLKHAEMVTKLSQAQNNKVQATTYQDLVPLTDYLFRYDRGAFWTGRYAYSYFLMPFNRLTRWLLDSFMHTRVMYHALHRSGLMQRFIIQDMAVPNKNIPEFSAWLDSELPHIYPRWLCPLKTNENVSMHPHLAPAARSTDDVLLNIGVWGPTPRDMLQVAVNRKIEQKLKSLHGMKWLYAQTFYTEDEFWQIYDRNWYEALRKRYGAEKLPSVYEKVKTKFDVDADKGDVRLGIEKGFWSLWPFAGLYGVLSVLRGGDYLRKN
ncbi:delta24-sterol reductase [Exophiala viscosa]|uniref:delta24-sterol reductase n=1 Tax=Exophiala viscosa TaxID=2486360 RepID=UPI00219A5BDE|nr:delta24-sterol reductase [Exophiala viscosa]